MIMNEKLTEHFNKQINREFYSAYMYFAMSTYFMETNYDGFASYMKKQAEEELGHAQKIHDYLLTRNAKITLERIEAPNATWVNPVDIFESALEHEKYVTQHIHNLVKIACDESDYAAKIFLADFVTEQVEEESTFYKILESVRIASDCPCGMRMLDAKFKRTCCG